MTEIIYHICTPEWLIGEVFINHVCDICVDILYMYTGMATKDLTVRAMASLVDFHLPVVCLALLSNMTSFTYMYDWRYSVA